MIKTSNVTIRCQVPSAENNWLKQGANFSKKVYLAKDAEEWEEVTEEEKLAFEKSEEEGATILN